MKVLEQNALKYKRQKSVIKSDRVLNIYKTNYILYDKYNVLFDIIAKKNIIC